MPFAILLVPELAPATGPDLTRYFVVCALVIVALLAALWVFRRFVAERLKARAAKRSLQVLDVLPLSAKHKLVVVRCYDRSFLLGLGEKEVRSIAELDLESGERVPGSSPVVAASAPERSFATTLAGELVAQPPRPRGAPSSGLEKGVLA